MRIDAHHHFLALGRCRYDWLDPSAGALYADHGPEDLAPHYARAGIDGSVLVQAADTVAETRMLLDVAARTPFVRGVVGWVPLAAPDVATTLAELGRDRMLVGVRPMLQDLDDPRWILRDEVRGGLDAVAAHELVFDALVRPPQLDAVVELTRARPKLAIVLDHAGKPRVSDGLGWSGRPAWERALDALAASPLVDVKLSGLVSEAGPDWTVEDLRPWVDAVLARFGPRRVLWGSDWPVCRTAGGFERWWDATQELLRELDDESRADVLGRNAARRYGLRARADREPTT